jgi:hypothetical protein
MGFIGHLDRPDESVFKIFEQAFKAHLSSSKHAVMRELFPGSRRCPGGAKRHMRVRWLSEQLQLHRQTCNRTKCFASAAAD